MKLIIAGGRDYSLKDEDLSFLNALHFAGANGRHEPVTEVVSGGATGADFGGEKWAESIGIPVKRFLADWKAHGKAAGPIRNRQMAEYADAVVLFPGGRGTASMKAEAIAAGIEIFDFS